MDDQATKPTKFCFCLSSCLYNSLQNPKSNTLVIDTRDTQSFQKHHITGSINLNDHRIQDYIQSKSSTLDRSKLNVSDIMGVLDTTEAKKFTARKRCFCFFIMNEHPLPRNFLAEIKRLAHADDYDDFFQVSETEIQTLLEKTLEDADERESIENALDVFKIMQKDRVREMFIILDEGMSFFERYQYIGNCIEGDDSDHEVSCQLGGCAFPHDILEGKLFLGSFAQSENYDLVSSLKITHILNITNECCNVHEGKGIKYLKVSILDEPDKNILSHFKDAYEFIAGALKDSTSRILVHCAMGKSRSATIVIMYLMKRFCWTLEKALTFVKRKRDVVDPNVGFIGQLECFEKNGLNFIGMAM